MSVSVADRVDDWDQRPFEGGYGALRDLADAEFSGVVRAGGGELFMTAGTVVGIDHGSIEDFESGSGTAFEAPVPALPLLAVMQAADADVRAQYYTEETPISEVDNTLSDGGFTGFLELSENVLSGDYFLVYHGGNSMAVGFVGASERLISGDEAFETANDEVGIYKVYQVDVEPIEIPEAESESADAEATDAGEAAEPDAVDEESETAEASATPEEEEAAASTAVPEAEPAESTTPEQPAGGEAAAPEAPAEEVEPSGGARDRAGAASGSGRSAGAGTAEPSGGRSTGGGAAAGGGQRAQRGSAGQAGDLETRAIPSLDPDLTHVPPREAAGGEPAPRGDAGTGGQTAEPARQPGGGTQREQPAARSAGGAGAVSGDVADLQDQLAEREAEIERLEEDLEAAEADRDELQEELEELVEERDELAAEVERLEAELERLEQELGAASDAERRMTPSEAIEGTNLFVDYDSKGAATLEKAHGGSESFEEVAENLQLGVHTEFDEAAVAVNGRDFDQFLHSTLHYRFAEWLVGTLLFEIRDTGHAEALTDLYDAIPEIRRVEFNGAIDVEYTEDGQEKGGRERFDVIFRHRMGDPLVVANLNDARDPATGGMMETLVTAAERVGQTADSLSAAFLVTSSFFESEALETVSEATQGGILSRDKRKSFVNLSRKTGYHLCLVAAREGNFHMEVPEL